MCILSSLKDLNLGVYRWMLVYELDEKVFQMLVDISGMS